MRSVTYTMFALPVTTFPMSIPTTCGLVNEVEVNLGCVILDRHLIFDLDDLRSARLFCKSSGTIVWTPLTSFSK